MIKRPQRWKMPHNDVNCAVQVIVMETKKLLLILLIGAAVMVNGEPLRASVGSRHSMFAQGIQHKCLPWQSWRNTIVITRSKTMFASQGSHLAHSILQCSLANSCKVGCCNVGNLNANQATITSPAFCKKSDLKAISCVCASGCSKSILLARQCVQRLPANGCVHHDDAL